MFLKDYEIYLQKFFKNFLDFIEKFCFLDVKLGIFFLFDVLVFLKFVFYFVRDIRVNLGMNDIVFEFEDNEILNLFIKNFICINFLEFIFIQNKIFVL